MKKRYIHITGCKQARHMCGFHTRITQIFVLCFVFATAAQGSFYAEDRLFTLRPDETAVLNTIERFGPVGLEIG